MPAAAGTVAYGAYIVVSATGVQTFAGTWSSASYLMCLIVTFKAASAGPTFLARPPYIANQAVQRAATW